MAAAEVARARLLRTDWAALCRCEFFCFACESQVCGHCCSRHGHRASHHLQERVDPLHVERVGGRLAIDATKSRGCGYDMSGIQRIRDGGRLYILLLTVDRDDLRCDDACEWCQFLIKRHCRWCSLQCKINATVGGSRRPAAQRLTELAAQGQFEAPVLLKDRFCSVCRLAFSSASCPDPLHGHAAAGPDAVKTVLRFNGWAAVPQGQLPDQFVANVQELQLPDGVAYPIHPRPAEGLLLPDLALSLGLAHACQRAGCHETFAGAQDFCSLRCRHQAALSTTA